MRQSIDRDVIRRTSLWDLLALAKMSPEDVAALQGASELFAPLTLTVRSLTFNWSALRGAAAGVVTPLGLCRLAAVAMTLAGALALSAASFWIYRFDMRPYDDDLTDDQQVCDVGCQLEFAAGSLAMILGFVMCCLANGVGEPTKLVGGPPAADLDVELAIPAEYTRATTPKHWRRPDARAGTPPYYVSPIADVPRTEV